MGFRSDIRTFIFPVDQVHCGVYGLEDSVHNRNCTWDSIPLRCQVTDAYECVIIFDGVACAMERGDTAPLYAQFAIRFPDVVVLCLSGVVTFVEVQYMVCHSLVA